MYPMPRLKDYPTISSYCIACDIWNKRRAREDNDRLLRAIVPLLATAMLLLILALVF